MAKSLVDYTLQNRYAATSQVSGWLSGQLGDMKKEAETLQGKVEQLQRESGIYSLGTSDAQGKEVAYSSTLDRLQQATLGLSTATSSRILKGALYTTVQNGDPELISVCRLGADLRFSRGEQFFYASAESTHTAGGACHSDCGRQI